MKQDFNKIMQFWNIYLNPNNLKTVDLSIQNLHGKLRFKKYTNLI